MKNLRKILGGLALALFVAGCADIVNGPVAPAAKPGTLTLTVGAGPARTVAPGLENFGKILLAIEGRDDGTVLGDVDASGGSATVKLPLGSWVITAKAYSNVDDDDPVAASEAHDFSWDGATLAGKDGETVTKEDTRFVLVLTGDGPGTLLYTVTVPQGVALADGSRIQIEGDGSPLADLDDNNFTDGVHAITGSEADKAVSLPAGRYVADILLQDEGGKTAEFRESVVILPGLVTKLRYEPEAELSFLDPAERALITETDSLAFAPTANDQAGIYIDDELTPTADPSVYTLAMNAPGETNPVYFTLAKEAAHSVSAGGTHGALVSAFADGDGAETSEAGPELAVFAVDTTSVIEEGGDLSFTLTVEQEGKTPVTLAVTLTVEEPPTPMLWIDGAADGQPESLTEVPNQKAITNLTQALEWINTNSANTGKYVVLLSKEGQGEMTGSFESKASFTNVRITLRGADEPRQVYTSAAPTQEGIFFILNTGTTLALDENITLDGRGIDMYLSSGNKGCYFVHVKGGALEMKAKSRITKHAGNPSYIGYICSVFVQSGAFRMDGGVIDEIDGVSNVVRVRNGSFEMRDGAKITNNNLVGSALNYAAAIRYGTVSAVVVGQGTSTLANNVPPTFTMHGGEISDTNYRGVAVARGASATQGGRFIMEGGAIKNNGKAGYGAEPTYAYGGGVFIEGGYITFRMEGGEISGNGHNGAPGSGIFVYGNVNLDTVVLNGPVTITNNTIAFHATEYAGTAVKIGPNFSTAHSLNIELCDANWEFDPKSELITAWTSRQLLLAVNAGITFNDSAVAAQFILTDYFFVPLNNNGNSNIPILHTDISGTIDQYGVVTLTDTATP